MVSAPIVRPDERSGTITTECTPSRRQTDRTISSRTASSMYASVTIGTNTVRSRSKTATRGWCAFSSESAGVLCSMTRRAKSGSTFGPVVAIRSRSPVDEPIKWKTQRSAMPPNASRAMLPIIVGTSASAESIAPPSLSMRNASTARCWSSTSKPLPNHRATAPVSSNDASARTRIQRYVPSAWRRRHSDSLTEPARTARDDRETARDRSSGWTNRFQPSPSSADPGTPVTSLQRSLTKSIAPDASTVKSSAGVRRLNSRYRFSALIWSLTSCNTTSEPAIAPASSTSGDAQPYNCARVPSLRMRSSRMPSTFSPRAPRNNGDSSAVSGLPSIS